MANHWQAAMVNNVNRVHANRETATATHLDFGLMETCRPNNAYVSKRALPAGLLLR